MEIAEFLKVDWQDLMLDEHDPSVDNNKVITYNAILVGDFGFPRHPDQRVVPLRNGKYSTLCLCFFWVVFLLNECLWLPLSGWAFRYIFCSKRMLMQSLTGRVLVLVK